MKDVKVKGLFERRSRMAASAAAIAIAAATPAWPQSASPSPSDVRPTVSADDDIVADRISLPHAPGVRAPEGAEAISLTVADISVAGGFPGMSARTEQLADALTGRTVTVAELYGFAEDLQNAYFEAGYPLARVVLPPQDFAPDAADIDVAVIDGYVERVEVEGVAPRQRGRVAVLLERLVNQSRLTNAELERALLLAGGVYGVDLTAALASGESIGATVLVVEADHRVFSGAIGVDNRVPEQFGDWQVTLSGALNSPLGGGEQVYLTYATTPEANFLSDDSVRNYVSGGITAPIGFNGVQVGVSADRSSTRPEGELEPFQLHSQYSNVSVFVAYPVVLRRTSALDARLAIDFVDESQVSELTDPETRLYKDQLRVVRFGLSELRHAGRGVTTNWGMTLSRGLSLDDADAAPSPLRPLSRVGADSSFTSLAFNGGLTSTLTGATRLALAGSAQYAFNDPLLQSERFSPLGRTGLSGPPAGSITGDSGWSARGEFSWLNAVEMVSLSPYVSVAAASIANEAPSELEASSEQFFEYGVGLRLGAGAEHRPMTFELEWLTVETDAVEVDQSWVRANLIARF